MDKVKIPEIYFDHKTIHFLRYIKWHKNCTEGKIIDRFHDSSYSMELINMCLAGYLVATRPDGTHTDFRDGKYNTAYNFRYWVTPKGRKVLDDRFDRLWQWSVPTLISVAALIISIISAIHPGIISVMLMN